VRCFDFENHDGELVPHVALSLRERQILSLLVRCHPIRDIADILGISPHTVKSCLRKLSVALECHGRAELVRWSLCYPQALGGGAAPQVVHAEGCLCGAAYCQIGIHRVG
jgi:DNA-binding CsgD family transcriptional regulator